MEIQASTLARERTLLSVSSGIAERWRPLNILYILIEAEVENNVKLLKREGVYCME